MTICSQLLFVWLIVSMDIRHIFASLTVSQSLQSLALRLISKVNAYNKPNIFATNFIWIESREKRMNYYCVHEISYILCVYICISVCYIRWNGGRSGCELAMGWLRFDLALHRFHNCTQKHQKSIECKTAFYVRFKGNVNFVHISNVWRYLRCISGFYAILISIFVFQQFSSKINSISSENWSQDLTRDDPQKQRLTACRISAALVANMNIITDGLYFCELNETHQWVQTEAKDWVNNRILHIIQIVWHIQ